MSGKMIPIEADEFDGAFGSSGHNGETAERFLAWWGDEQMAFYGKEALR